MKRAFILIMLIVVGGNSFGQDSTAAVSPASIDYVQKSKHQKTAAWVMLGGGLALAVTGVAVSASNWESSGGDVLLVIGGASMIGSIPLFIASGKNKRRAASVSMEFEMQSAPLIKHSSFANKPYPSLSIKLNL